MVVIPPKSLGESLVKEGIINKKQLKQAKEEEKKTSEPLRHLLVKMGFITEKELVSFISDKLGLVRIELSNYLIEPEVIELISEELARKYELIPVTKVGKRVTCAMVDPLNTAAMDYIGTKIGLTIEPGISTVDEVKKALNEHYSSAKGNRLEEVIKSIDVEDVEIKKEKDETDSKELEAIAGEPTVIKLVNLTIIKAIKEGASDIHIEPLENAISTRFRIDGMLQEVTTTPKNLQAAIISRIKIMANMDIAERRAPQDGRFSVKIKGKEIDIRVSCIPTIFGENIVLRLLDVSRAISSLDQIGFSKTVFDNYQRLIYRPHGIILVTGPTGSGKTTTLYASLNKLNTIEKNIITVENPVEYKLDRVRQIQVNPKAGLTFASGLRSIVRQDPDIIMIGEMRDMETAEIAVRAALTGHLVFSTLHTNDAPGAVSRLLDIGIEPYLISDSVIGILAQRLIRTICPDCKKKYKPTPEELKDIGLAKDEKKDFYTGGGCSKCGNTGYKGRIGIFELMILDDKIRELIVARTPVEKIKSEARASGMITLKEDGIEKINKGLTSIKEVLRVTMEE